MRASQLYTTHFCPASYLNCHFLLHFSSEEQYRDAKETFQSFAYLFRRLVCQNAQLFRQRSCSLSRCGRPTFHFPLDFNSFSLAKQEREFQVPVWHMPCPLEIDTKFLQGGLMKTFRNIIFAGLLLFPVSVCAELPWQFDQHTRYMALGDSLAAGYGAVPATQGYVYLLYQSGVFDTAPNT